MSEYEAVYFVGDNQVINRVRIDSSKTRNRGTFSASLAALLICTPRIASGGHYGFRFVTPPPQCVERFHRYRSNEKNVIASLLKFAGYIHNHKILPRNIFGLILKNKMATPGVFRLSSRTSGGTLEQSML